VHCTLPRGRLLPLQGARDVRAPTEPLARQISLVLQRRRRRPSVYYLERLQLRPPLVLLLLLACRQRSRHSHQSLTRIHSVLWRQQRQQQPSRRRPSLPLARQQQRRPLPPLAAARLRSRQCGRKELLRSVLHRQRSRQRSRLPLLRLTLDRLHSRHSRLQVLPSALQHHLLVSADVQPRLRLLRLELRRSRFLPALLLWFGLPLRRRLQRPLSALRCRRLLQPALALRLRLQLPHLALRRQEATRLHTSPQALRFRPILLGRHPRLLPPMSACPLPRSRRR
jgi:hypothetical protein